MRRSCALLFDAIGSGNLDAIRQMLSSHVTLTIPGSFHLAGVFHPPDEFLRGFGQLVQASAGTLRVEPVNTAVNGLDGYRVVADCHATGTLNGEAIDEHNAYLIKVDHGGQRDGKPLWRSRNCRAPVDLTTRADNSADSPGAPRIGQLIDAVRASDHARDERRYLQPGACAPRSVGTVTCSWG
jgi:hypothetical protein